MHGLTTPFSFLASRSSYEESRYIILCVPYDSTESWATGTRFGPAAVIEASRYMDNYDIELELSTDDLGIHTIFELSVLGKPEDSMMAIVETSVRKVISDGKMPVILGGEHTVSLPALIALKDEIEHLIVLDAHPDLYDEYEGRRVSHATVCRRMSEIVKNITLIGVRTMSIEEKEFLERSNHIKVIYANDLCNRGEDIFNLLEGKRVYLSVDVDVLDPPQVPCIGNPEPGGLNYRETLSIIRKIIEVGDVKCMDFVEFSPCSGMRSDAYLVARLVQKAIGYHSLHLRDQKF
ncbi:MAG: agmatinase [Candidatus Korarchaeum sp.]|nr:agmatinase [Candidatus Korarchaeum sp.]MDW8035356.1 agmatinase [Candidatus Korarchaeum sp.]